VASVKSFGIGFVAGISPFVFMQLLPLLLNQDSLTPALGKSTVLAILIVGLLVGFISSIMLTSTLLDADKGPREVFLYALGIPAVLIATVSNLSTRFTAMNQVSSAREDLSAAVLSPLHVDTVVPEPGQAPPSQHPAVVFSSATPVLATVLVPQPGKYLLIIGEYLDSTSVRSAFKKLSETRLRSERYIPKSLRIVPVSGAFLLVYSAYSTAAEANRAYQLLRINDPDLPARVAFAK
jgi:hypothetical protein